MNLEYVLTYDYAGEKNTEHFANGWAIQRFAYLMEYMGATSIQASYHGVKYGYHNDDMGAYLMKEFEREYGKRA